MADDGDDDEKVDEAIAHRLQKHDDGKRWSEDFERVGMIGEQELADFFGMKPDLRKLPRGDGGIDLLPTLQMTFTIEAAMDVKSAQRAPFLLVNVDRIKPWTIYVLCEVDLEHNKGDLLGWQWGHIVMKAPTKNWCKKGVIVHYVEAGTLRKMEELAHRHIRLAS